MSPSRRLGYSDNHFKLLAGIKISFRYKNSGIKNRGFRKSELTFNLLTAF